MTTTQLERAKAPNERIDWAYSMTLAPENKDGTPTTIVIGKPEVKQTYAHMLPSDIAKNDHMYALTVAMNIIHGDKRIECLATCVVSGRTTGNTFELKHIHAHRKLTDEDTAFITALYERPIAGQAAYERIKGEMEQLCRKLCEEKRIALLREETEEAVGAIA